jgi:predicted nucleic acid-binding protein
LGLIYLDTCLVIYLVEKRSKWGASVAVALASRQETKFAISPLVKLECLVGPLADNDDALQNVYRDTFPDFELLDMPEPVYLRAAAIRASSRLKTSDALHLACAQHHRCDELWTNDGRLNKASHGMARNIYA